MARYLGCRGETSIMKKMLPTGLLILGIAIIVLGLMRKDDAQATIDLGKTEIDIGKADSAFNGYYIVGGLVALAGVVFLVRGSKA